jgi:hypothetical protein
LLHFLLQNSFKALITSNRERYFQESLTQKKEIILEILRSIQQRAGRFLSPQSNGWITVSNATARQKIAHSLQYRQRCSVKQENISSPSESLSRAGSGMSVAAQSTVAKSDEEVNIGIPRTGSSLEQIYSQEHAFSHKVPQNIRNMDEVSSEIAQFMASREKHTASSLQILPSYSSSHSVKSLEVQLDHRRTYSDHELPAYHVTADSIGFDSYANTAMYYPTTEPQLNYQQKYPCHQLVTHTGAVPYTQSTQSSIPGSELDFQCDAYQYSYPLPSTTAYAVPTTMDEDRKLPPILDALDLSGVHSLTTILSRQESAEYNFLSYPQYTALKNSEPADALDDDIIQMPPNSGSDDSISSVFSNKGSPYMKSL